MNEFIKKYWFEVTLIALCIVWIITLGVAIICEVL